MPQAAWELPDYRETIQQASTGERKYIRYCGSRGHFAHLRLMLLPCPREPCVVTKDDGLPIPETCYVAIRNSLFKKLESGPIHGYPMIGLETRIIGATFLPRYSHEEAFAQAASMALDDALPGASLVVLERWSGVTLRVDPSALSQTLEILVPLLGEMPASISRKQYFVIRTEAPVRLLEEIRETFSLRRLETYPLPINQQFRVMTSLPPKRVCPNSPLDDWT